MIKTRISICFVLLVASFASCAPPDDKEAIKAEIGRLLAIQEKWYGVHTAEAFAAIVNETCADSLLFIGGDDGGILNTAESYVRDQADGYLVRPYQRRFQVYDNTVIVTSLHQGYKVFNDDTLKLNSRSTKIFAKVDGNWRMVYVTYAPTPVLYNQTIPVREETLSKYEGVYQLAANTGDTVKVIEGKLYSVAGSYRSELLPVNDSTFLGQGYFGRTVFSVGNDGKISHYTFEWTDGQRIAFMKIQ